MTDRLMSAMRTHPWLFPAALTVILLIANSVASSSFLKPDNWPGELAAAAPVMLIACASTPAIVSGGGGIDLSIGPLAVLVNVLLVNVLLAHGLTSAWIDVPILLALGLVAGVINGVLVGLLRFQPVIATLCMVFVFGGVSTEIGAAPIPAGSNWTDGLGGKIAHIPGALVLLVAVAAIWFLLSRTSYHRNLYATGGNDTTAYASGVDVARVRLIAYAIGGLFAAFGGIAITAQIHTSEASNSSFYVLVGLAAVALGGIPLTGGVGGMVCAFLGGGAFYLIEALLTALSVPSTWVGVVYGVLLLVGVVVGALVRLRRPTPSLGVA